MEIKIVLRGKKIFFIVGGTRYRWEDWSSQMIGALFTELGMQDRVNTGP